MTPSTRHAWGSALALSIGALAVAAPSATPPEAAATASGGPAVSRHSLLSSRELWATVDVCNPADEPNTVGIRGSMPGDGHDKDTMYMSFQLQYLEAKSNVWVNLAHDANSGFIEVGPAKMALQGGSSFQLTTPVKGTSAYTLRGVVTFQWRRYGQVVHSTTRTTSAGHQSVAGADPAGYSAAECIIS
jgi:hypothetical protein